MAPQGRTPKAANPSAVAESRPDVAAAASSSEGPKPGGLSVSKEMAAVIRSKTLKWKLQALMTHMKAERAAAAASKQPKHPKNAEDKKEADHSQHANKFTKVDDVNYAGAGFLCVWKSL